METQLITANLRVAAGPAPEPDNGIGPEFPSTADINIINIKMTEGLGLARHLAANWFAVYTSSRHEKKVAAYFGAREIQFFLPLYAARHRWANRCAMNIELPLFPGYVFVRIASRERVRVLEVPGVLSMVGFGRIPAPLPDFEIEALRSGLGLGKIEPHPFLVIGERVRIKRGPMAGMEGILVRRKSSFRVVLALDVIMKCVAVEVDAEDVEAAVAKQSPAMRVLQARGRVSR
jgi:transcription antitermination factor NusG